MDTDRPIKVLFERQGQSLLPFIGERRPGVRVTAVEACDRTETLRSWTLQCPKLSDEAFARLVTGKPRARAARSRAARPSRRSTKRR